MGINIGEHNSQNLFNEEIEMLDEDPTDYALSVSPSTNSYNFGQNTSFQQ